MRYTLNLACPDSGSISHSVINYPDGQGDLTIPFLEITPQDTVTIKSRLRNFSDLELIICAVKALRNLGAVNLNLYIPYLLGARSDRRFTKGRPSYLVEVVAPIINSLNFSKVEVLDVHSDVAAACINNLESTLSESIISEYISDVSGNFTIVSPDAGANKRIEKYAQSLQLNNEVVTCSKVRNLEGKITETIVPKQDFNGQDCVIIDDICDGGATFIEIAKVLSTRNIGTLSLIVTHGIFSNGAVDRLKAHGFDRIYCSNSYSDIQSPNLKQLNVY